MRSIKFLAALFVAILMTLPTFAQRLGKGDRGLRGQGMMQVLDLTAEQEAKAKALGEAYRSKFEAIRNQETDREVAHEKMRELRTEQEAEFKKILTADQIAKLDAQKAERKARREAFKEKIKNVDKSPMKEEMKAYKDKNIKPVLLEQRKKLEPQISAADKAEIKQLRVAMKAAKKEMKAVKDKYKDARVDVPSGKRKGSGARTEIKAIKDKYASKHDAAQALADKYDTQITALLAEVEDKKATWDADTKAIKDKYFGEIKEEYGKHPRGEKSHKGKGKRGEHRGKKGEHIGKRGHDRADKGKVAFLLMDVNKGEKKGKRKKR